jgi:hypothetical protein
LRSACASSVPTDEHETIVAGARPTRPPSSPTHRYRHRAGPPSSCDVGALCADGCDALPRRSSSGNRLLQLERTKRCRVLSSGRCRCREWHQHGRARRSVVMHLRGRVQRVVQPRHGSRCRAADPRGPVHQSHR